jgi:glycosyltransferase involved in cell wall biosynthesis
MNIIFFAHPQHSNFRSMKYFTDMLASGMKDRGHNVDIWIPEQVLSNFTRHQTLRKWLGYIDQYIIFPIVARRNILKKEAKTLYVFTDLALGPWVPLVADKAHVIHCHDFLALQSATGEITENRTSFTGKIYQSFIRKGYQRGKHFISVSEQTNANLSTYLGKPVTTQKIVYNGLKPTFHFKDQRTGRRYIHQYTNIHVANGYFVHVGGNQWYKNRVGVVEIYNAFREISSEPIPLLLIGEEPSVDLLTTIQNAPFAADIHILTDKDDQFIQYAYSGALALLFPSLAEGFGWPIAEAMACGTLVITTNQAPMTEVGGTAAFYIERKPTNLNHVNSWAKSCGFMLKKVMNLSSEERVNAVQASRTNATRFNLDGCLDEIESIYMNLSEEVQ